MNNMLLLSVSKHVQHQQKYKTIIIPSLKTLVSRRFSSSILASSSSSSSCLSSTSSLSINQNNNRQRHGHAQSDNSMQIKSFHHDVIKMMNSAHNNDFLDFWYSNKVPKGFENFDKDDKKGDADADADSTELEDMQKKWEGGTGGDGDEDKSATKGTEAESPKLKSERKEREKKWEGGTGGDGNDSDPNNNMGSTALTLLALILLTQLISSLNDSNDGEGLLQANREITWTEFQNYLLEPKYVDRIKIAKNNTTAYVYVKPGAPGIPQQQQYSMSSRARRSRLRMNNNNTAVNNHNSTSMIDDPFDDNDMNTDIMEMGPTTSSDGTPTSTPSSEQNTNNKQHVYLFTIGSVESFERKLDQTQRELGFKPKEFVSVQYTSDSTITSELFSVIPTFLLMAMMVWFVRGLMNGASGLGGMGGRGGPGGIFQMGKSTHKKIKKEDINVTFKDVAGCQEAKREIMEFVDFLKDSERFTKLGAKIPKGALLCGPP